MWVTLTEIVFNHGWPFWEVTRHSWALASKLSVNSSSEFGIGFNLITVMKEVTVLMYKLASTTVIKSQSPSIKRSDKQLLIPIRLGSAPIISLKSEYNSRQCWKYFYHVGWILRWRTWLPLQRFQFLIQVEVTFLQILVDYSSELE